MDNKENLRDYIEFSSGFKTAINLYLSLNKTEKVLSYIPTLSSVKLLGEYLKAVKENKEQATLLVGPYGKGKSHLLLVLLAILSLDRNEENNRIIEQVVNKVREVEENNVVSDYIEYIWSQKGRFLPVLISNSTGDLNQAFIVAINDALKRDNLVELTPDTYYSAAIDRIEIWERNYSNTFTMFCKELAKHGYDIAQFKADLGKCSKKALDLFIAVFPQVTSGSEFNPLAVTEVLPLYKSISEKLAEDYGYSGIYIVFDEFSKFIESQDGQAAGSNMKLLQDMCELASDSQNAQVFFTMVAHKSIKEYGKYLSNEIINSFTGIEGRIIEKYFVTSSKNNYELIRNAIGKKSGLEKMRKYDQLFGADREKRYYQLPAFRSSFSEKDFRSIILEGCFPLSPIAAYLLLNVSEKVAQNERTLFTFISNDEAHSMARFVANHTYEDDWVIGADLIYDYFEPLFKKEVTNEYVHNLWLSAEYAIEKCASEDSKRIIKALAIVLIVNKEDEIPADEKYLSLCTEVEDSSLAIAELVKSGLIYKKGSTGTFVFKTRAGSELKAELRKQREIKGGNVNVSKVLLDITGQTYYVPRKYNAIHMMTRYFVNEYMRAEDFCSISSPDAFLDNVNGDGKVVTIYSDSKIAQEVVKKHLRDLGSNRIVVVCPQKPLGCQKQIRDYEILQEIKNSSFFDNDNDILQKEIPLLSEDLIREIEKELSLIYEEDSDTKVFFCQDGKVISLSAGQEEQAVNQCCESVYFKTPIVNNEMVNRSVIRTGQTKKARLTIIQAILQHKDTEEFYSGTNQEATVYRSLFVCTGIVNQVKTNESINEVLNEINRFVDVCSERKTAISELIKTLTNEPYGMRCGLIPFYLAYILANRREDIVVYFADKEVELDAEIVVNMCEHAEDYTLYVSKEDLLKEKYIGSLNELFEVEDNRNLSDNRIKDILICMQRWFRSLPQVVRNCAEINEYVGNPQNVTNMMEIKRAMQKVEFNPFEQLLVEFPAAFSVNSLEESFRVIDYCKTAYDDYFDWIQRRVVSSVYDVFGGKKKKDLYHCLEEWYDKQSTHSKQGLYSGRITNFMSCIEKMNVYNDEEVAKKIAKAVSDVYIENWTEGSFASFVAELQEIKKSIEGIGDQSTEGEMTLSFVGKNGGVISKLYSYADEGTGSVLRNIIEDTLEEYNDLSVNDRVSILLEMIEKIIK